MKSTSILISVLTTAALVSNAECYVSRAPTTTTTRISSSTTALYDAEMSQTVVGRRMAFQSLLGGIAVAGAFAMPQMAHALDFDSFANAELDSDTKNCNPKLDPKCAPKLTADEAMCKYGQSGEVRGEACKRVKASGGQLPGKSQGKSPGGAYAM